MADDQPDIVIEDGEIVAAKESADVESDSPTRTIGGGDSGGGDDTGGGGGGSSRDSDSSDQLLPGDEVSSRPPQEDDVSDGGQEGVNDEPISRPPDDDDDVDFGGGGGGGGDDGISDGGQEGVNDEPISKPPEQEEPITRPPEQQEPEPGSAADERVEANRFTEPPGQDAPTNKKVEKIVNSRRRTEQARENIKRQAGPAANPKAVQGQPENKFNVGGQGIDTASEKTVMTGVDIIRAGQDLNKFIEEKSTRNTGAPVLADTTITPAEFVSNTGNIAGELVEAGTKGDFNLDKDTRREALASILPGQQPSELDQRTDLGKSFTGDLTEDVGAVIGGVGATTLSFQKGGLDRVAQDFVSGSKKQVEGFKKNPSEELEQEIAGLTGVGPKVFLPDTTSVTSTVKGTASKASNQLGKSSFDQTPTFRDLVEGDVGETGLNPSEVQNRFAEEDVIMGRNVPEKRGSIPTRSKTRTEFLREAFEGRTGKSPEDLAGVEFTPRESRTSRLKNLLTNKRKGQAQILKPKQKSKDTTTEDTVSISDRVDRLSDNLRDLTRKNTRGQTRSRGRDGLDRSRTEFNKPGETTTSFAGNTLSTDPFNLEDQTPRQRQFPSEDQRQPPFEEQQREQQPQRQDNDNIFEEFLQQDQFEVFQRESSTVESKSKSRSRNRGVDFGQEDDGDSLSLSNFFNISQDRNVQRSVGADLLGIEDKDLSTEQATNPLSLRGLNQN